MIRNPILPGFNPDPSICRMGNDYYIATSTFEWYPGVQLHHSTDLVNWRLVKRPLDRPVQLDMRGNPDSGGVWAPCLSHADGKFWLVYTDVKRLDGNFKDAHNYIVTAPAIEGPWSDPVYVNSSGFDPSLFHDDDGKKWFLNMVWNHVSHGVGGSPKHPSFAGILLQEFDARAGKLVGPVKNIFAGSPHGLVEGPHLFKRNGWYYLTTAEGGTGYDHAVTMARARKIDGPYELHPDTHIITSKDAPDAPLQRAGHGQMVETPDGEVYHTHLCSRPLPGIGRSPLGRETAIQKCEWGEDGWLRLSDNGPVPRVTVPAPSGSPEIAQPDLVEIRHDFDAPELPLDLQWLRTPHPERLFSLTDKPGLLRLFGREIDRQLVRPIPGCATAAAFLLSRRNRVPFRSDKFPAGGWDRPLLQPSQIPLSCSNPRCCKGSRAYRAQLPGNWPDGKLSFPLGDALPLPGNSPVRLAVEVDGAALKFFVWSDEKWNLVGPVLDASVISDEGGRGEHGSFTGAFVGMAAFDTSGAALPADFEYFSYAGRDS